MATPLAGADLALTLVPCAGNVSSASKCDRMLSLLSLDAGVP